jgi:hypothetical protein
VRHWDGEIGWGGDCSSCCFRNWRKLCGEIPCFDKTRPINVSWHAAHVPEDDVVTLLNYFRNSGGNPKELAENKKAELFEFLEAGNTIEEWKSKKYADAWKGMSRS